MTPEEQKLVDESFTHMDLESKNLVAERVEQLKALFPEIAVEGDGTIDFEKLRLILGDDVDEGQERYAFTWPGKADAIRQAQAPSTATLRPDEEASVDWDNTENLYIEGDNLEVLKLLQRGYHGKVKMIYIDPPYNTGHDFVYKDSFQDSIENYKEQAGLSGQSNADTSGRYHSDWLSMMYPRLRLARELLRDDGVLFASIDDNEQKNLKELCDEIFGESSFVGQAVWQKRTSPDMRKRFSTGHEYLLIYVKDPQHLSQAIGLLPLSDEDRQAYKNPDNDPRGPWTSSDFTAQGFRPNQMYEITTPGGAVYTPPEGTCWKNIEEEYLAQAREGRFWYGTDGKGMPRRKTYLAEREGRNSWTWWPNKEVGHTQEATKEFKQLFSDAPNAFDFPKPTRLLMRAITLATSDGGLVLDFFSGSATTAHAIFRQNAIDGKERRFILMQLPESSNEQASKVGLNTLCEIGQERIRRAGQITKTEIEEENKQLKLGEEPKAIPDIGFRVLKLDSSNFEKVAGGALIDDLIKPGRTNDDIIFEMMLKWGLELSLPMEKTEVASYPITSIAADELICCMDKGLTVEALEVIARLEPKRVFFLDSILTDTLKLNAAQIFKRVGDKLGYEIELRTA